MSLPRYPEYKDSGVRWLGEVPAHWDLMRLRRCVRLNPSKSEVAAMPRDLKVSFLPMEAVGDDGSLSLERERPIQEVETGYTYFRDGDVAFAKITPCFENGKGALMSGLTHGVGFGTTELTVARPIPDLMSSAFLHWIFRSPNFRSEGEASMYGAGGQKRVPDDFVRELLWAVPPDSERERIAIFLDRETAKIDALIAEQEKLLALLAEKRQATISRAVTHGLTNLPGADLNAAFGGGPKGEGKDSPSHPNAPLKDSGIPWLGEVPAHWEVVMLRRVVLGFEQGWSPECEARLAEGDEWGVLKAGCVNGGQFRPEEHKALPSALDPRPELEIRDGDVLMSRASGSPQLIGSVACVDSPPPRLMLSDKVFRLKLASDVRHRFFALAMRSVSLRSQIEQAIGGAEGLANNLPQARIKDFWLALPSIHEQIEIERHIEQALCRFDALEQQAKQSIDLLKERRSALISAAVTGKIDVRGLGEVSA